MLRIIISICFGVFFGGAQIMADPYDYEGLAKREDIQKLIKSFHGLRLNALAVPENEKRPDLFQKTQYWTSQNVALREYCKNFFHDTPHTVQTVGRRIKTIEILGYLTSEWSVRLLFEEVMIDRTGQETAGFEGELTPERIEQIILSNGGPGPFRRNDTMAASKLLRMRLAGAPGSIYRGVSSKQLKELREWYLKNKHRLDEVVKETWGEHAVLDRDISLEAGKTKKSNLKNASTSRGNRLPTDDDRRQHSGKGEDIAVMDNLKGKWLIIVAAVLFFGVVFVWLKVKSRA